LKKIETRALHIIVWLLINVAHTTRYCAQHSPPNINNNPHSRNEEEKSSVRVGTADLLTMMTTDEPNVDFTLALGADTFIDLVNGKWRRSEDVLRLVGYRIVVFRRSMKEDDEDSEQLKQSDNDVQECIAKLGQRVQSTTSQLAIRVTQIPDATNLMRRVSVSSSAARCTTDEALLRQILSDDVLNFIKEKRMYAFSE
jgi:hypothetical protein